MPETDKMNEGWENGRNQLFVDGKQIYEYHFQATILPEEGYLPQLNDLLISFEADDSNHCLFQLNLKNNSVEVILETQSEDFLTLSNHLSSLVQLLVDGWGFLTAQHFSIELTKVTHPDGSEQKFHSHFRRLHQEIDNLETAFKNIISVIASKEKMAQNSMRRALADYREGMKNPIDTGFFSYRAIEDIMQFFNTTGKLKDKKAWINMRKELQVDEDVLYYVEESFAAAQRHGKIMTMSEDERVNCLTIVREIIHRFCQYCLGEFKTLSTLPLLKLSDFGIIGFSKKKIGKS